MAFKFTKADKARHAEIVAELRDAHGALESAVEAFNDAVKEAWEAVAEPHGLYLAAVEKAERFRDDMVSQAESDLEDKSEKWQESEAGERAQNWASELRDLSFAEFEAEKPEKAECPDDADINAFDEMPQES